MCSEPMKQIYKKGFFPGAFSHKFTEFSSHCTPDYNALLLLTELLNCKEHYRLFEFLNDTLVHIQLEVSNIRTSKMFKTEVLNFLNQKFQSHKF